VFRANYNVNVMSEFMEQDVPQQHFTEQRDPEGIVSTTFEYLIYKEFNPSRTSVPRLMVIADHTRLRYASSSPRDFS